MTSLELVRGELGLVVVRSDDDTPTECASTQIISCCHGLLFGVKLDIYLHEQAISTSECLEAYGRRVPQVALRNNTDTYFADTIDMLSLHWARNANGPDPAKFGALLVDVIQDI